MSLELESKWKTLDVQLKGWLGPLNVFDFCGSGAMERMLELFNKGMG